jgi:hypothetical protein
MLLSCCLGNVWLLWLLGWIVWSIVFSITTWTVTFSSFSMLWSYIYSKSKLLKFFKASLLKFIWFIDFDIKGKIGIELFSLSIKLSFFWESLYYSLKLFSDIIFNNQIN